MENGMDKATPLMTEELGMQKLETWLLQQVVTSTILDTRLVYLVL